jgi:uncharacterized metal-binding protein
VGIVGNPGLWLAATVGGLIGAAQVGEPRVFAMIAMAASVVVAISAHTINHAPETVARSDLTAANMRLIGLIYGWGAASMVSVYAVTGLNWYHWGQYGGAMAAIACVLFLIARRGLSDEGPNGARQRVVLLAVTIVHGAAALIGALWLIGSGKLTSVKVDWPSNWIFLAGGLAVAVASGLAAAAEWRLQRQLKSTR